MSKKNGAVINPTNDIHFHDHLVPIAHILDIPYIVRDKEAYDMVRHYYPDVDLIRGDTSLMDDAAFFAQYDVVFHSMSFKRNEFYDLVKPFETQQNKIIRSVHCHHGWSDKYPYPIQFALEDIQLIYGQHVLDFYDHYGYSEFLNSCVDVGNYRYRYYREHRNFFDALAEKEIFGKFKTQQPTIFYAPTWTGIRYVSSLSSAYKHITGSASDGYNIVIKLHPNIMRDEPHRAAEIIASLAHKDNVVVVPSLPLVYPILSRADIYIGDMSSVGYDFLAFNKPMFFLNENNISDPNDRQRSLFRCGTSVAYEEYGNLYDIIAASLNTDAERFSSIRSQLYHYTFGEDRPLKAVYDAIISSYDSPRKRYEDYHA